MRNRLRGLRNLNRAFMLVWGSAPGWTVAGTALVIVQSVVPLASMYLMKLIVDGVTGAIAAPGGVRSFAGIGGLVALAAAAAFVSALCRSFAGIVRETQAQVVTDHVADIIHEKSVAADLAFYDNPAFHDTLHRAQQEAPFRPVSIVASLTQLCNGGLSFIAVAGLLIYLHWAIALVLLVALAPGIIVRIKYSDMIYAWQQKRTKTERKAHYFHWVLTDGAHARELRLFGLGCLFIGWYRNLSAQLRKERLGLGSRRAVFELATQTLGIVALFGTFAFIAGRTLSGAMTLGDMVLYYQAFQRAQGCLQEILSSLAGLYEDNLFLSNFYAFLDLKPEVTAPPRPAALPEPLQQGIVFSRVSFRYPGSAKTVLQDIDLCIPAGKVVALVGENGSGKTTLAKLLCRFYDPESGEITLDGIDLRRFDVQALRKKLTVIFQDYMHYHLTARENIWLGNIEREPADPRIVVAAEQTGAAEALRRLDRGFDTQLGRLFEDGQELSIGEWQKLALARAFFSDARVIILDEPTSSMDARAEHEVFTAFRRLLDGRTAVLISHRFSTVRMADCIYVLEQGRILEHGSHDELVRRGGKYASLFDLQARHYK
ncbi:MAG: ABC transporter ATP-binding protein [Deltaproteobacteria bacterium]|nr:ABC transporter ATP-binding protein [Deltaproteobacteria bacterium]